MERMRLPEEFKEFINLLNLYSVKYVLLGGWAVGYYSNPRATKDIDFLVSVDNNNLKKLKNVFNDFKSPPINIEVLKEDKGYIYIGSPPLRIEVISNADGININECYKKRNIIELDDLKINIISKNDLIKNKKSTDRLKDKSDAEVLEKYNLNPEIKTKDILKLRIILSNIVGAYSSEIKYESKDMKKRKKDIYFENDLDILNKTILLYNKAIKTKSEKDVFNLHKSFKNNPLTNSIYDKFKYKALRKKIYDEIEYRYKLLLKNEYSYLINKKKYKNNNSNGKM
jgi:hypothetical protein